jgi:hypothetical protein
MSVAASKDPAPPREGRRRRVGSHPILSRLDGAGRPRHSGAASRADLFTVRSLRQRLRGSDVRASFVHGLQVRTGRRDGPQYFLPLLFGLLVLPLVSVACGHATLEIEHAVAVTTLTSVLLRFHNSHAGQLHWNDLSKASAYNLLNQYLEVRSFEKKRKCLKVKHHVPLFLCFWHNLFSNSTTFLRREIMLPMLS